ncbi:hypothetical protein NSA23_14475 [Anaerosalibacter massiliensis]|uniref:Uncharacterized protein n=1 Tax=Anaerosalibacter massiliensis TaxID=1347392 RepID=A0A9X2MQG3_9FIRM|nr:hypothetical protein [Anaerosalibacter massiliensis]MCR2045306.1 hypothetical protein [Anaerosalibacter massiliensis]
MDKKINLYFFGELGVYDEYNPAYVCNREFVPYILYLIAYNEPFCISKKEITKILRINEEEISYIINGLDRINAIEIKRDKYKLNFPVFLEDDIPLLDKHFSNIGKIIGDKIIENRKVIYEKISRLSNYPYFSKERLLYHVICDDIFDGIAFDFFEEKNIFSPHRNQPGNRDYIIFGYEDNKRVERYSDKILCSSNNYDSQSFVFNSFGDSNGIRKDMFRFFNKVEKTLEGVTLFKDLNLAYIKVIEEKNKEIAEKCGELIWKSFKNEMDYYELNDTEKNLVHFLIQMGYLNIDKTNYIVSCNVPVFQYSDREIIHEVSDIILNDIYIIVKTIFEDFSKEAIDLTAIKHKVNIKEIAIELWHQVFGLTNEYLAGIGFVESPKYIEGEGRYLRSFSIKNYNDRKVYI